MSNVIPLESERDINVRLDSIAKSKDLQQGLRFKYGLLDHLPADLPAKDWIIKGVVAAGETTAWIGPPGSLKSALIGELIFAIATKQDWHGKRAKRSGLTIYFALERADLVKRRLIAYRARFAGDPADIGPIAIIPGVFNLMDPKTIKDVIASIRAAEAETGEKCIFAVWDTFAKIVSAGGGDENKAQDMGKVCVGLQRVQNEIGCHMALIGHTGKDEGRGARGSNAFDGHVDVVVQITGEEIKTASVMKANDIPEGPLFSFKSELHEFGHDEDGDPITVNVVSADDLEPPIARNPEVKLTPNQRTMLLILSEAGKAGLLTEEWNAKGRAAGIGERRRADLTDARAGLKAKGIVREYLDRWHIRDQ